MLIGTAGHIDHGKTTLIRALTGVDTDRLPEEKQRGISIELGFAYLPLPQEGHGARATNLAFIDVPGHERFVPTMLAGAAGIDFALLVVAADDGPMPQTVEHLAILDLLGVSRGAVALTKIDRASPEQRAAADAALRRLLAGSPLAEAPIFPVAAPTGEGVEPLRDHLRREAAADPAPEAQPLFRLAVDRSFSVAGAGTVVTGTILAGRVALGDTLSLVKPGGERRHEVRVRGLHANNRRAEVAGRGMRCAVNLAGIGHHEAGRGDWLVSPALGAADKSSQRLDVVLDPLPDAAAQLKPGIDLHLHHGAQHTMARLVPLDAAASRYQLVARQPLLACHGDRLIVRDASGQRTLAGARVLDPRGPLRHRQKPERLAVLEALRAGTPADRLAGVVACSPNGVDLDAFALAQNAVAPLPPEAVVVEAGARFAFSAAAYAALLARLNDKLAGYHAQHPDELGLERERLRRIAAPQLESRLFAAVLAQARTDGELAQTGSAWHLTSHRVELSASELANAKSVLPRLLEAPYDPPWVRDLAACEGLEEAAMRQLLRKLAAQGEVFQIVRDLFYHRQAVGELVGMVLALAASDEGNKPVKAAALRDRTGLGRKRAIQILEFFDRVGFTRRVGSGQQQAHALRGEPPVEPNATAEVRA